MSNPIIRIHNSQTDEVIDREMTDEEFAKHQEYLIEQAKLDEAEAKAATDRAALLTKLGLTADEFKTLLGGN